MDVRKMGGSGLLLVRLHPDYAGGIQETVVLRAYSRDSISAWRELLCKAAADTWGHREGRDWRIVQDCTVFGIHATGCGAFDGEVIELR